MKRIRNTGAFCMVLLLLLGLAGCAEPSISPSAESSSELSSQVETEMKPYVVSSLESPLDDGMTYGDYYAIERVLKPATKQGEYYNTPHGDVCINENEISLIRMGITTMLYRQDVIINQVVVDEEWIMWMATPTAGGPVRICRIYLPTLHFESLYSSGELWGFRCLSSTDIRLIELRNIRIDNQLKPVATVYSLLTGRLYVVEDQEDDVKVRETYLPQRELDMGVSQSDQPVLIGTQDLIIGSKNPALYREYLGNERLERRTTQYGEWRTVGSKIYENGTGKLIMEFRDDIRTAYITEEAIYFISGSVLYRYHPVSQTIDLLCRELGDCDSIRPITNHIVELCLPNPRYGAEGESEMIYRYVDTRSTYSTPIPMNARIEDRLREWQAKESDV